MYKTTITDNYILITSYEKIKDKDIYVRIDSGLLCSTLKGSNPNIIKLYGRKVTAHLPIKENIPTLRGVLLLPPLPSVEDEVEKLAIKHATNPGMAAYVFPDKKESFIEGYNKSKEKYKFTEEDAKLLIDFGFLQNTKNKCINLEERRKFIQSLSQPKMPIGFKCEVGVCPRWLAEECEKYGCCGFPEREYIKDGVMQGEWIY